MKSVLERDTFAHRVDELLGLVARHSDEHLGRIVRDDVDQCPRSALRMLAVDRRYGVTATWYFRWRTARPAVIGAVRKAGGGWAFTTRRSRGWC